MSVTIIGKSSFLARQIAHKAPKDWRFLSHREALNQTEWIEETSCVLNCAFSPEMARQGYQEKADIDSQIARKIADYPVHYIMLSSRLVYGRSPQSFGITETHRLGADTPYGEAKKKIEHLLADILPPKRLTILRLANLFGFEPGRTSFIGQALTRLREENRINFNMSPFSRRDFLPADIFAAMAVTIAQAPKAGIFNLGSGFALPCGEVAEALIKGYEQGMLLITDFNRADQFSLETTKAHKAWDLPMTTPEDVLADLETIGARLKNPA